MNHSELVKDMCVRGWKPEYVGEIVAQHKTASGLAILFHMKPGCEGHGLWFMHMGHEDITIGINRRDKCKLCHRVVRPPWAKDGEAVAAYMGTVAREGVDEHTG